MQAEEEEEEVAEEYENVRAALAACICTLPSIQSLDEPLLPRDHLISHMDPADSSILVALRTAHQTQQAACGVRTQMLSHPMKEPSTKVTIIRQFQEILQQEQGQGIGTGLE